MSRGNSSRRRARKEKKEAIKKEYKRRRKARKISAAQRAYREEHYGELNAEMKSCKTKKAYASKDEAFHAILNLGSYSKGTTLRAYYCKYCGKWHITSAPYRNSD